MSGTSFSVGQRVRISSAHRGAKDRAMIACSNTDNSYDIFYDSMSDSSGKRIEEEHSVQHSRIEVLHSFEGVSLSSLLSSQKKEFGNILFKLQDLDASIQYYKSALDSLLLNKKLSVGSPVLVQLLNGEYYSAIISDEENGKYDVLYDNEEFGEEGEEEGIIASRLILMASGKESGCEEMNIAMQRAVYMNLSRCHVRTVPPSVGWAVRMSSLAIGISRFMLKEECSRHRERSSRRGECSFTGDNDNLKCDFDSSPSHAVVTDNNDNNNVILPSASLLNTSNTSNLSKKSNISTTMQHETQKQYSIYSQIMSFLPAPFLSIFVFFCRYFTFLFHGEGNGKSESQKERTINLVSAYSSKNTENNGNANPKVFDKMYDKNGYTGREYSMERTEEHSQEPSAEHYTEPSKEYSLILKQLCDGYYLRSKAYIMASRPQLAKKDALFLETFDPKKSRELLKEIEIFIIKRNKSNKKLARDVAEWVDQAYQISADKKAGKIGGNNRDDIFCEDIPDLED